MQQGEPKETSGATEESAGHHHLEALMVRRLQFARGNATRYRLYDKPGHFHLVEAECAHEALEKSGLTNVIKIEKDWFATQLSLSQEDVHQQEEEKASFDLNPSGRGSAEAFRIDESVLGLTTEDFKKPFIETGLRGFSDLFAREMPSNALSEASSDAPITHEMPVTSAVADAEEAEASAALSEEEVNALLQSSETEIATPPAAPAAAYGEIVDEQPAQQEMPDTVAPEPPAYGVLPEEDASPQLQQAASVPEEPAEPLSPEEVDALLQGGGESESE